MNKYHVSYYYLATGMEGHADTKDYGIIEANSKQEALDYVVNNIDTWRAKETNDAHKYWGLNAQEI